MTEIAPPAHRPEVLSAYFVVTYLSFAVPSVLAALAISSWGLTSTFVAFGSAVTAVGLAVAVAAHRAHERAGWTPRSAA